MHFAEETIRSIKICGRSPIPQNSIHIKLRSKEREHTLIAEFKQSAEYTEMEFPVNLQIGTADITFMFLPGSNFDFKWFQFIK
jgi:beta-galactosidase